MARTNGAIYRGVTEHPFTVQAMQNFIDQAREQGFIVYLNHPSYSMPEHEMIKSLDGVFGMKNTKGE